tara:strand:- start:19439 stop:20002 length:564 start_codon:yes stop_codon:yes gene_type:complete
MIVIEPEKIVTLRSPVASDGPSITRLIRNCPPLDENSIYCNLLQCTHFAETSVVGEFGGELVASATGYLVPAREDILFIWQVAVSEKARGHALGRRMLDYLLSRPACAAVTYLETTVTEDNGASWSMFERFADRLGAQVRRATFFDKSLHFGGTHETEILARIGPLQGARKTMPEQQIAAFKQESKA